MKLVTRTGAFIVYITIFNSALNAQDFYVKEVWETQTAILGSQNYHASTVLDASGDVFSVANKRDNGSQANIHMNKLNGQGTVTWQNTISNLLNISTTQNFGTDIKRDQQGNTYICGAYFNGSNYDLIVVKYNDSGTELWRRVYNGTGNLDDASSNMVLDASGNVYVTGASYGVNSLTDIITLKINGSNGTIAWTARYDFSNKYEGGSQVRLDNQGYVYVGGSSAQNNLNADFVVLKYNPSTGAQMQVKRHNTPQNGFDLAVGMEIDQNNNIYLYGSANYNVNRDIKLVSYDASLNINWVKYYDGSGLEDEAGGVAIDNAGDVIVTGHTKSSQGEIKMLTAKYSRTNGNLIWMKQQEITSELTASKGKKVKTDDNGNVIVVGDAMINGVSHVKIISYDAAGNKRWEHTKKNTTLSDQQALDLIVKGNDIFLTGVEEINSDPNLFTVKMQPKEVIIAPDFNGENFLTFCALETNAGQLLKTNLTDVATEVKYYNEQMNPAVFITDNNIALGFHQAQLNDDMAVDRIDMDFLGSNTTKTIMNLKRDELTSIKNYYLPHHPEGYTGIREYSRIIMGDVYPHIDVQYYSGLNGMKYYMTVKPGGSPQDIRLQFTGADHITVNNDGSLDVHSEYGFITFNKPIAYQLDANRNPVELAGQGGYIQVSSNVVVFNIKEFNHNEPLFIQMAQKGDVVPRDKTDNFMWCTYYGGPNKDEFNDLATDEAGNVYFVGSTIGLNFPQAGQTIYPGSGNERIVCGSHESLGKKLWSTIYGSRYDIGQAIATDRFGNVFITGISAGLGDQNNFIDVNKPGAFNMSPLPFPFPGAASYAFIIKFAQSNGVVTWSSLYGDHDPAAQYDGKSIVCDNNGRIYIAGTAKRISSLADVTDGNAYFDSTTNIRKGFIAMFTPNNSLGWSTMYGNENLTINDITLGPVSSLFVTGTAEGTTTSDVLPANPNNPSDYSVNFNGGATDAFVAKFDFYNDFVWSSFIGGSGDEQGNGISVANNGDVAIVGRVQGSSTGFPHEDIGGDSYFEDALSGTADGFITVFDASPNYYIKYSTFFGGPGVDYFNEVDYSDFGNLYVIGTMASNLLQQAFLPGAYNQYLLENTGTGTHTNVILFATNSDYDYVWSTLVGGQPNQTLYSGTSNDLGNGIAVYKDEYLYIGGETNSQQYFPVTQSSDPEAYWQPNNGSYIFAQADQENYADGFLGQLQLTGTVLKTKKLDIVKNQEFIVFPNPTDGKFTIFGKNDQFFTGVKQVEVMDLSGKIVKTIQVSQNSSLNALEVDISDLPDGFYSVLARSKQQTQTFKLIKQ